MSKILQGKVVSDSQSKTIVVRVDRRVRHPLYNKAYTTSKKFQVHDEENQSKKGDIVDFQEVRPISKTKKWSLVKIVDRPVSAEDLITGAEEAQL
ncbi:MAG TPA: 30S ribosomal protein S17 [Candidatus Saccharibacteria bacterium]|jgi:small subunit ribosomal protein S17|nr:30S ribosomal protein S17 [Candidatus Saccharibacteria bacterium]